MHPKCWPNGLVVGFVLLLATSLVEEGGAKRHSHKGKGHRSRQRHDMLFRHTQVAVPSRAPTDPSITRPTAEAKCPSTSGNEQIKSEIKNIWRQMECLSNPIHIHVDGGDDHHGSHSHGHNHHSHGHMHHSHGHYHSDGHYHSHEHQQNSSDHKQHSPGHKQHSKGHKHNSLGHKQHAHGHKHNSPGHRQHSPGHKQHSQGHKQHSHGHEHNSAGHKHHSHGHEHNSAGHKHHSHGHEHNSSGHTQHSPGHEHHSHGHHSNHNHDDSCSSQSHGHGGQNKGIHIHVHVTVGDKPNKTIVDEYKPPNEYRYARCVLKAYSVRGTVIMRQKPDEPMEVKVKISGMTRFRPKNLGSDENSLHGLHVHQYADSRNRCLSFGGHYNPENKTHGLSGSPKSNESHPGDWGNVECGARGVCKASFNVSSSAGLFGHRSIVGRGIVLHKMKDDLGKGGNKGSVATGNAGRRLACCGIVLTAENDSDW